MFNKVSCMSTRWLLISASQSHTNAVADDEAFDVLIIGEDVEGLVEEAGVVVSEADEVNKLTKVIVLDELDVIWVVVDSDPVFVDASVVVISTVVSF